MRTHFLLINIILHITFLFLFILLPVTNTVEFVGVEELVQLLNEYGKSNMGLTSMILQQVGEEIAYEMAVNAPVDTGFMAGEIGVTEVSDDHVKIESPAGYSGFVNFGTWKQEPQPFFSDTVENIDSFLEGLRTAAEDALEDAVNKHKPRSV